MCVAGTVALHYYSILYLDDSSLGLHDSTLDVDESHLDVLVALPPVAVCWMSPPCQQHVGQGAGSPRPPPSTTQPQLYVSHP
jgi:hypothetical protein